MFPLYLKIFVYFNLVGVATMCIFLLLSKQKGSSMPESYEKKYKINNPRN